MLQDLLVLVGASESDPLGLDVADLVLHAIHLRLVDEALEGHVLLRQLDADLACLVIQRAFELPVDALRADLAMILILIISNVRLWHLEIDSFLQPEAQVIMAREMHDRATSLYALHRALYLVGDFVQVELVRPVLPDVFISSHKTHIANQSDRVH